MVYLCLRDAVNSQEFSAGAGPAQDSEAGRGNAKPLGQQFQHGSVGTAAGGGRFDTDSQDTGFPEPNYAIVRSAGLDGNGDAGSLTLGHARTL